MIIYDAHIHNISSESGGFIIGTENEPYFEGTLSNKEALKFHSISKNYLFFYYVTKKECLERKLLQKYLKYHPRREKYSSDEVIKSIARNNPKAIIIDTLNEPYWISYDYWKIAREFSELPFVFAHAGGYLINEFIKICHFQSNVWLDFSFTQTILGCYGNYESGLPYIDQAIKYALNSSFKNRILLSSDYPFCNQGDVFKYYDKFIKQLNDNFIKLFEKIK